MASKPLFEKIKDFIIEQIDSGDYKVGDKIPTEMELSKQFGTSRQTVNKALRDLVLDDVIERFPRSGSFVKAKVAQTSILELKNIADEVKERAHTYDNQLLSLNKIKANENIAKILQVVKDQEIYLSEMIHRENGVAIRFDKRYIKPSSAKEYINQNFKEITPSRYLQKHCPVEKVENIIEAIMANEEIQRHLDISKNEPCLRISRVVTSKGQVASYSKLYYPSSRYKLNSTFYSS